MKYISNASSTGNGKANNAWLSTAKYPPSVTPHGSHLLSPADVYLNAVLGACRAAAAPERPAQSPSRSDSSCLCRLHNLVHFSSWEPNSAWLKVSPAHFCRLKKGISVSPCDRRQRLMVSGCGGCTPAGCRGRWYQRRAKSSERWEVVRAETEDLLVRNEIKRLTEKLLLERTLRKRSFYSSFSKTSQMWV